MGGEYCLAGIAVAAAGLKYQDTAAGARQDRVIVVGWRMNESVVFAADRCTDLATRHRKDFAEDYCMAKEDSLGLLVLHCLLC